MFVVFYCLIVIAYLFVCFVCWEGPRLRAVTVGIPVSVKKHSFHGAFALRHGSRDCKPAPDFGAQGHASPEECLCSETPVWAQRG